MSFKQFGGFDCAPQEEFNEYLKSVDVDENEFKIYADNCVQKNWNVDDSRINLINQTNTTIMKQIDEHITKNNKSPADKKEILENLEFYIKTCGSLKDYAYDEQEQESYKTCVKIFLSNSEPVISEPKSILEIGSKVKLESFTIDPKDKNRFVKYSSDNSIAVVIIIDEKDLSKKYIDTCLKNEVNLNEQKCIKIDFISIFYNSTKNIDNLQKEIDELLKEFLIELITYFDLQGKPFIYLLEDTYVTYSFREIFDLNKEFSFENMTKDTTSVRILELKKQKSEILKKFNIKQGDGSSLSDDKVKEIIDYIDTTLRERNLKNINNTKIMLKDFFNNNTIQINNKSILLKSCKTESDDAYKRKIVYFCILDDKIKVQQGGYYQKYLKYKNKYLELKKRL